MTAASGLAGLMMDIPLTIQSIMRHAERQCPEREIVSVTCSQPRHRYTYSDAFARVRRLAAAMRRFGIRPGDRVATLAWNDYRHFELYYAIACMGAVTHTVNPRLFPQQIAYILNHAGDRLVFVDPLILPVLEQLQESLEGVESVIVLADEAHMPKTSLPNVQCYESFLGDDAAGFQWPALDEQSACTLCYTSGTTGHPKGVLYSHRSMVIHSLCAVMPDCFGLSMCDVIMPAVPMFHVNAWGLCYSAPMVGAKLVLPGPKMGDGAELQALIEEEQVTFSAGVPTVWLGVLRYLRESGRRVDSLKKVVIGGSACPWSIMEEMQDRYGVYVHHAWGMTEMSPLGTVTSLKPGMENLPADQLRVIRTKQGRCLYGVELKIVDENNRELPWDGVSAGVIKVRGPCVCREYFRPDEPDFSHDADGWFATGDVGTIDTDGFLQITDRTKDVIKSGGEWISSIELENAAVGHPAIAEAAAIAVAHPRWTERPLLLLVRNPGEDVERNEILEYLGDKVPKWWLPDDVLFVDEIPHTATGKILKSELRKRFQDHKLPDRTGSAVDSGSALRD